MTYRIVLSMLFAACCACRHSDESKVYLLTPTIMVCGVQPPDSLHTARKIESIPPTKPNMVYVPGGYVHIGSDSSGLMDENPRLWLYVQPFWMDISPVSVAAFRVFVEKTQYVTEAEKFGDGGFIDVTSGYKWTLKKGANWQYPQGRDFPHAPDDFPVTQVSWNDATAYAKWAGKRLPHEWEWEHAARNAVNQQTLYAFGDSLQRADGSWKANIWQGHFPFVNQVQDGYRFASPVGIFGKTALGLTDMTGNVWQWCANARFKYADVLEAQQHQRTFPSDETQKAQKGGSYLCEPTWCHGYRVSGRSFTSPETALMHVGFRCVQDVAAEK